jgi:hypothetical protein
MFRDDQFDGWKIKHLPLGAGLGRLLRRKHGLTVRTGLRPMYDHLLRRGTHFQGAPWVPSLTASLALTLLAQAAGHGFAARLIPTGRPMGIPAILTQARLQVRQLLLHRGQLLLHLG